MGRGREREDPFQIEKGKKKPRKRGFRFLSYMRKRISRRDGFFFFFSLFVKGERREAEKEMEKMSGKEEIELKRSSSLLLLRLN